MVKTPFLWYMVMVPTKGIAMLKDPYYTGDHPNVNPKYPPTAYHRSAQTPVERLHCSKGGLLHFYISWLEGKGTGALTMANTSRASPGSNQPERNSVASSTAAALDEDEQPASRGLNQRSAARGNICQTQVVLKPKWFQPGTKMVLVGLSIFPK